MKAGIYYLKCFFVWFTKTHKIETRYQDVFALLVPSCCDKSRTSCSYHLASCYELVVVNLLTTCYVQTISDFLEQLVASLINLVTR
jgi:hypothetical protein